MAANDPHVRKTVAASGGRARAAKLAPQRLSEIGRSAAAATNSATSLARRLAKAWPELDRAQRAEVRAILATIVRGAQT